MTIDPRVGFWIGVLASVLVFSATGAGATAVADIFPANVAHIISSSAGYFGGVCTIIVTALHAVPSKNTPQALQTFYLRPRRPQ